MESICSYSWFANEMFWNDHCKPAKYYDNAKEEDADDPRSGFGDVGGLGVE